MGINTESLREGAEDAVEALIASGLRKGNAIEAVASVLEALDDVAPALDRALDEDDYADAIDWLLALLRNPERRAKREARRSFRAERQAAHLKAGETRRAARRLARKEWRSHDR